MMPRVLIVGTVPYRETATSRAFDSYFHGWDKACLAQIFSNPDTPIKGHCATLYQITDQRMLHRWFRRDTKTGRVFSYEALDGEKPKLDTVTQTLYRLGSRKNSLVYLLRGILWRERFWHTEELDSWLEAFQPQCVFLSFSDDYFIPEIALYVAKKFQIPILSSIGDDYYFHYHFSLNPLYHLYKLTYRALIRRVFRHSGSAIYIDDKIRDKYNAAFGLKGRTVHLASTVVRRPFRPIDTDAPKILYCGNLRLGRNRTLIAIADALGVIDPRYVLDVYSNESDPRVFSQLEDHPNVRFHGAVPYREVQRLTEECDLLILAEGFGKQDVDTVRYSLSTKTADALASGAAVFACGHREAGAIEYCEKTGFAAVCTDLSQVVPSLKELLENQQLQKQQYLTGEQLLQTRHRLEHSTAVFQETVKDVMEWTG